MTQYFIDYVIASGLIIGITAFMGGIANGIGEKIFGGSRRKEYVNETKHTQAGWNLVGGKNKTIS
ncbi:MULTISPECIES: hypothetical protein [Parageobacillus]|jgi:hypothetical protein|uniref:Uncharacterized protein n=1 Tax=Parageobacillus thermoglucosidasius TaxID=1426 RepID=A0A1B7KPE7_PARTM|nr:MULTISPECIES: hypothetical protein [Parageobacillus]OAT71956.1 hypothetical protein A7K69_11150 [Parageobacillus thermoglucosidasius]BDG48385.1 hypothetical protein PspKH34_29460 [Parageobacillus sp. KH3-4]